MSSWAPTKCMTKDWSSDLDHLTQHGSFSIWFDPEMFWTPRPNDKLGRQQQFSEVAPQTVLTSKGLCVRPLREATGFAQSLLGTVGLVWPPLLAYPSLSPRAKFVSGKGKAVLHPVFAITPFDLDIICNLLPRTWAAVRQFKLFFETISHPTTNPPKGFIVLVLLVKNTPNFSMY
ncbi:MAG: transposase [Tateyamaria sp.]